MIEVELIRHGKTQGNLERRYIGRTDEPLAPEGEALLLRCAGSGCYTRPEAIFASPMRRCVETARILFGARPVTVIELLRECDFGAFEGKNFEQLRDEPAYRAWVDSGGAAAAPGGESAEAFKARSCRGFEQVMRAAMERGVKKVAVIAHGGSIMAVMQRYTAGESGFYDWQAPNGGGYRVTLEEARFNDSPCFISYQKICLPE